MLRQKYIPSTIRVDSRKLHELLNRLTKAAYERGFKDASLGRRHDVGQVEISEQRVGQINAANK